MLGLVGNVLDPDGKANVDTGFGPAMLTGLEAGFEVQPTQPPHSLLDIDIPSGYPDVSETTMGDSYTPDIAEISDLSAIGLAAAATWPPTTGGATGAPASSIRNRSIYSLRNVITE